jgi:hypothetical protein
LKNRTTWNLFATRVQYRSVIVCRCPVLEILSLAPRVQNIVCRCPEEICLISHGFRVCRLTMYMCTYLPLSHHGCVARALAAVHSGKEQRS